MSAYFIFDENVYDRENLQEYVRQAPPILKRYGGKLLTAGGSIQTLEGDWRPSFLVILEFESVEQARRWYHSEEYSAIKALRHKATETRLVLVEGTDDIHL